MTISTMLMIRQPTPVRRLGLGVLISLAFGCGSEGGESIHEGLDLRDDPRSVEPGPRQYREVEWTPVFRLGGTESDTTFYSTSDLEAEPTGLFVFDRGRRKVARLTADGEIEWWYGGPGRGPDEFMHVRDIERGPNGKLWTLDVENARLTVLDRSGRAIARVPIRDVAQPDALVPLTEEAVVLVTLSQQHPLVLIDAGTGRVLERFGLPWAGYERVHPLAAQMTAAGGADSFVVAFSIGNGFFTFRGREALPYFGTFVEHTPFPRVVTVREGNTRTTGFERKPIFSAYEIDIDSGRLYVLFVGSTEDRYRILDIYDLTTGGYLHSLKLPRSVSSIAVSGDRVYGAYADPYPTVVAWRWRNRDLEGSKSPQASPARAGSPDGQ